MRTEVKRKCCKVSTILGSTIMLLPNGVSFYWGNLAVYVTSYVVVRLDSTSGVEGPWTFSLFVGFWTLGLLLFSSVASLIGRRWAALLGFALSDLGIIASYFAIQSSFILLNFTLAVVVGIGTGLLQAHCLRLVVTWATDDAGFTMSITQGAFFWGASIIAQLTTLYINPSNKIPEYTLGNSVYFTQEGVLDRVPYFFLVLAGFSIGCHILAFAMLRENIPDKSEEQTLTITNDNEGEVNNIGNGHSNAPGSQENAETSLSTSTKTHDENSVLVMEEQNQVSSKDEDYTPRQALKSASFYILWTTFLFAEYPFILLGNYYKSFGQVYIHDDFFLTDLGTVMGISNICMRILWGYAIDKIGVRNVLITGIFSVALVSGWYYFTAIINKWFYFIFTNVFTALAGTLFGCIPVVAVTVFGETHFSTNYGLLRSSSIVLTFLGPVVAESILYSGGWFYVFASSGMINVVSLILILFFLK